MSRSTSNNGRWWVAISVLALAATTASAGTMTMIEYDYWHQQRAEEGKYDAVGQIQVRQGALHGSGSGILIGNRWVLTAAHVVNGADNLKFTLNGIDYVSKRWYAHGKYEGESLASLINGHDIALIKLKKPIQGVRKPTLVGKNYDPKGKKIEIVGYGNSGDGYFGEYISAGTKRAGPNIIDGYFSGSPDHRVIAYDFDAPADIVDDIDSEDDYAITLEYSGAHGDSGGGLFDENGNLVGLTSFSPGGLPIFGATVGNTFVGTYHGWIKKVKRYDYGFLPDAIVEVGSPTNPIEIGAFSDIPSRASYVFTNYYTVPEPAGLLLLTTGCLALLRRRA